MLKQGKLQWCGHVLRGGTYGLECWVACQAERWIVEAWREIVEGTIGTFQHHKYQKNYDMLYYYLNGEDVVDLCGWRRWWRMTDGHDGCEWVGVYSSTGSPGLSRTKSSDCVCVMS